MGVGSLDQKMELEKGTISIPVDIAYGSLSLFTSIVHNVFLLYHVDMFVSVYKIDQTSFWIGEMIFLVWNSLNDPMFGWISDKSSLSSGNKQLGSSDIIQKRIDALKWTGPLFAISFLAFWIQWANPGLQFVICLCVYDGFLTMIDLHHSALLADIAISAEGRTKLNSRASFFSIIGSASVFISYAVWNKDNLRMFREFCLVLTVISLIGFFLMTRVLKKIFQEHSETRPPKEDAKSR